MAGKGTEGDVVELWDSVGNKLKELKLDPRSPAAGNSGPLFLAMSGDGKQVAVVRRSESVFMWRSPGTDGGAKFTEPGVSDLIVWDVASGNEVAPNGILESPQPDASLPNGNLLGRQECRGTGLRKGYPSPVRPGDGH